MRSPKVGDGYRRTVPIVTLVAMTMRMVDFTVHDEKIVMTRKLLTITT